nr:cyclic pyranopterin monophosphate synthase MoaC [uncultured Anaeromusa sp.]
MELTHFNEAGKAKMVNVGDKADTERVAVATGKVNMAVETLRKIREGRLGKGDVLAVAQIAGIMAAKKTWELIPMCHPLLLSGVDLLFYLDDEAGAVEVAATVQNQGKTGVEMEALTAVSVAALTIYDMCKAVDKEMEISQICLVEKRGGRSGTYQRAPGSK